MRCGRPRRANRPGALRTRRPGRRTRSSSARRLRIDRPTPARTSCSSEKRKKGGFTQQARSVRGAAKRSAKAGAAQHAGELLDRLLRTTEVKQVRSPRRPRRTTRNRAAAARRCPSGSRDPDAASTPAPACPGCRRRQPLMRLGPRPARRRYSAEWRRRAYVGSDRSLPRRAAVRWRGP
jgi:hypothetical protein